MLDSRDQTDFLSQIAHRVLLILAYSAKYQFPLSKNEIVRRWFVVDEEKSPPVMLIPIKSGQHLVGNNGFIVKQNSTNDYDQYQLQAERKSTWQTDLAKIAQALKLLLNQGKIRQIDSTYALRGRSTSLDRNRLNRISQKKRQELQPLIDCLTKIGWVRGVAITGSLALNAADENADADLLIITQPHRLWLTRLLVLWFAMRRGKRRSFAHEEPNSWCFNLWLDARNLFVPNAQHSLYTAYEVCQADWVISRDKTAEKFLLANQWVSRILPYYYIYRFQQSTDLISPSVGGLTTWRILSPVFSLLEVVAYAAQRLYMMPHHTTERIARGYAWFHPGKKS